MQNQTIVHLVHRDKFSAGYIEFMRKCFSQYEHQFIVHLSGFPLNLTSHENISFVKSYNCLMFGAYRKLLKKSSKIIVTGVFLYREFFPFLKKSVLKKTFLHFWGGDFYFARSKGGFTFLKKRIVGYLLKYCRGTISLIDGDVKELTALFPNNAEHYVAGMPFNPQNLIDYQRVLDHSSKSDIVRIILGNSATPENHHVEILEILKKYNNESFEVYSPLSYGDVAYREKVIEAGRTLLGEKFKPMLEFLGKEEYLSFLATCKVGIFNNDRQQAMGNITSLLRMGTKVYLRDNTSMWDRYVSNDLILYSISDLSNCTFQELVYMSDEDQKHNLSAATNFVDGNRRKLLENWEHILEI